MVVIFFGSVVLKPEGVALKSFNLNKMHVLAYFCLSFIMGIVFGQSKKEKIKRAHYFFTILFSFLFGVFNEIAQFFVPWREFSLQDIFIHNGVGILLGFFILFSLRKNKFLDSLL